MESRSITTASKASCEELPYLLWAVPLPPASHSLLPAPSALCCQNIQHVKLCSASSCFLAPTATPIGRYTSPLLGALLQHGLRRAVSAYLIGGARLASQAWPPVEAWLRRALPQGNSKVDGFKRWLGKAWWRQAPPVSWRTVPAPYDPRL